MASAGAELQRAIYQRLTMDAALIALLGGARVYDDVPRGASFPYISFGPTTERDWSTGGEVGCEHTVTLHVWSRAHGFQETETIVAAVRDALHDQGLSLTGFQLINLRQEQAEVRRDPDGETRQGSIRLRAVTEPST